MSTAQSDKEVAVLGLGKSGVAATKLLLADGRRVYVSDAGTSLAVEDAARQLRDIGAEIDDIKSGSSGGDREREGAELVSAARWQTDHDRRAASVLRRCSCRAGRESRCPMRDTRNRRSRPDVP